MAADNEIRVVISGTAAQLREALAGAKGDLGGLSAAIKAVPDQIKIDVQAETTAAINRLRALQLEAGQIPDEITITADADTGIAMAKLALLNAKVADTQRNIAATQLGGSFTPPPPRGPTVAAGGGDGGRGIDLGRLLLGGGGSLPFAGAIAGTAAFGTLGSFAGLGVEHLITTLLSLAGSATAGAAGGGALALGSAGKLAVGGGSDAAVMKSTIADTKALGQAWQQVGAAQQAAAPSQAQFIKQAKIVADPTVLSDYQKLQQAIKDHGINSTQAATADTALSKAVKAVANPQLTAAFSAWQGQLSGIASATAGLNTQMKALGNTAGVQAELGLAKAASALNTFWDLQTSGARVQAVNILMQGINLAHQFTPLVAQAAQQNLAVINASLKPLFAWLQGPQGVQIFNDLENAFAKELPTAVHAFTQGLELFLRVVDIASQFTGGFVTHLDHLLTRLNSMDNAQIGAVVGRLVADFRLWDTFVKLLVTDVYLLFHQDVGTGNSIIQALTGMLERLHAYETSARGSAQIQSIFMVHKTEILALLALIPGLISGFGGVYMALAPPMVHAMTVILQIIKPVLDAIASIASSSQLAGLAIGGLLISFKFGGILATVAALKSLVQWLLGTKAAAAEATAANVALAASETAVGTGGALETAGITAAASRAGLMTGTSAVAAGTAGFTSAEGMTAVFGTAGIAGSIRAAFAAAAPAAGAAIGLAFSGYVAGHLIHLVGLGGAPTVTGTPLNRNVAGSPLAPASLQVTGGGLQSRLPGFLGSAENSVFQFLGIGGDPVLKLKSLKDISGLTSKQVTELRNRLHELGVTKVNVAGVTEPLDQVLGILRKAAPGVDAWNRSFNQAWQGVNTFFRNTGRGLVSLKDDFDSNMRLIAHTLGVNSDAGRRLVAQNVSKMVLALETGMLDGKIKVAAGIQAINQTLKTGVATGALNWRQQYSDMFDAIQLLYAHHKISTHQFLSEIGSLTRGANQAVRTETQTSYRKMFAYLKQQYDDGYLTKQEFDRKVHAAQLAANQQAKIDMGQWAANVVGAVVASAKGTSRGIQIIGEALTKALKALGASSASISNAQVLASINPGQAANIAAEVGAGVSPGGVSSPHAGGGLVQIGREGERGRDTIPLSVGGQNIVVGAGEKVAVFNHDQQQAINQDLAHKGGLPGFFARHQSRHYMATGGVVPGFTTGGFGPPASGSGGGTQGDVYPFPPGTSLSRVDMGQDASMPVGSPIGPIGPAIYGGQAPNWYAGQPIMWWQLAGGPRAGSWVYLAEQINPKPWSGVLQPNQAAATFAGSGTGIEMGWAAGNSSQTLAQATTGYSEGQVTPAGQDFANFIAGLARGVITGGGGAGSGVPAPVWKNLAAPTVKGSGALVDIVRAALTKVTGAANAFGSSHMGAAGSSSGSFTALPGGWFRTGATIDPTGGQTGDSNMTFAELLEAGTNAGMRPDLTQLLGEPRGTYGMPMGTAIQIRMPGANHAYSIRKNDVGSGQAGNAHYTIDLHPGIASALGWSNNADVEVKHAALGGLLAGFATGGYSSPTTAPKGRGKKGTGKKIPPDWLHRKPGSMRRHKKHKGLPGKVGGARGGPTKIGTDGPFPFDITDLPQIDKVLSQILGLDGGAGGSLGGGDAAKMSDLITWNEQLWGSSLYPSPNFSDAASPGNFVISTDAAGNAVTPYISTNINQVVQQLSQIVGWEGEELTDMQGALKLSQGLGPAIQKAIARRQKEVAKIRKRIEENSRKIVALLARIKMLNQKKPPHAKPKTAAERAENAAFDRERKWEIAAANLLIGDYEKENVQLGGAKRKVGSPAGGELGTIGAELGTPASTGAMGTVLGTGASATGGLYQLQSVVSGWVQSLSGVGGALESTGLTFAEDKQTLAALLPGANVALSAAAAQAAGQTGPDLSALNALLQQELDQSRQAFALSQAQFNVFQGFEPLLEGRLLGSFQSGTAFVPHTGPYLLHRGEQIIPDPAGPAANSVATVHTSQGAMTLELHFANNEEPIVKLVDARMNKQALKIVSSHSGQRARLMSGVRRP